MLVSKIGMRSDRAGHACMGMMHSVISGDVNICVVAAHTHIHMRRFHLLDDSILINPCIALNQ